eukprot:551_1
MRWRKNNKTDSWYPLLVLSTDTESAIIWNGVSADKIDKTSLYQRGDMHRSLVKQSDMALKQLLSYSHTMMKSLHESQELVRETQAEMQQQNEQIHNQIKSSKDIKWMKWKHGYEPVRVVQPGDQNPNACFVFDIQNRLHNVDPCYLLPYPPYKKAFHIAAHVRKLNSLCTDYPWNSKDTIKCGRTKCSFQVEQSGWFTTSRGTITATIIAIESTNKYFTKYWVERHDNGTRMHKRSDTDDFKILSEDEIQTKKHKMKQLETKNTSLISNINELQWRIRTHEETIQSLQSNNAFLSSKVREYEQTVQSFESNHERLQSSIHQFERRIEELQSQKDDLEAKVRQSSQDITNKSHEIKELQTACHEAITCQQDFEKKFKTTSLDYERLKQQSANLEKRNKEQRKLVTKLRERNIENSPALDLSRGFPPIQDIVRDFATVKSQYHVEAGKQTKKALKQKHKGYSRLRNHKFVCEILFDILMKS